jgi:hypothetical protein
MLHMKVFDSHVTLRREPFRGSARARKGRARVVAFVIGTALFMSIAPVSQGSIDANKNVRWAKQLAKEQLTDKQELCHHEIVYRESRWDYKAIGNLNGTKRVYGLYQMKTESLKNSSSIKQFWMYYHYVGYRYGWTEYEDPNYCNALHHLKTKGWQ